MRSFVPNYQLIAPKTLDEALRLLSQEPGVWKPFAGGTDLMVLFEAGKLSHQKFINIWNFPELKGIHEDTNTITLGALTTYSEIRRHKTLAREFPSLCHAARETGAIAIQNRGTLGGNIINASPAADSPPALLVYDAELILQSIRGTRTVPYAQFHTGYKTMDLASDELLLAIQLPRKKEKAIHYYRKVGTRRAQAISKVCLAGWAILEGKRITNVRIALGSVAPIPLRCPRTEAVVKTTPHAEYLRKVREAFTEEIAPIDDLRSTVAYRQCVAGNLLEEFLTRCGTGSPS